MKTIDERLGQNQNKILNLLAKRYTAKDPIKRQILRLKIEKLFKEQDRLIERQVGEERKVKKAKQQKIALKIQAVEKRIDALYAKVKALDPVNDEAKRKSLLAKVDSLEEKEAKLMERHWKAGRLFTQREVDRLDARTEKLLKKYESKEKSKGEKQ